MSEQDHDELELTAFYADEQPGMAIAPDPSGRGFVLLNERRFVATWTGGAEPTALQIRYDGPRPSGRALSDKGDGILSFVIPYLFRTPPGFHLLVRGPSNDQRDGISALEALVEADCAASPFLMRWQFTRPGSVVFQQDEPICLIVPQSLGDRARFRSAVRPVDATTEREWRAASRRRHGVAVREYLAAHGQDALASSSTRAT